MTDADAVLLHREAGGLPPLHEVAADLLRLDRGERALELAWPPVLLTAAAVLGATGRWVLATAALLLFFPRFGVAFHDLLHRSLGLSDRANQWWLTITGALALQSGHAVQLAHLAHHRHFPSLEDPEAAVGRLPWWRGLLEGPLYQYRIWRWALVHRAGSRAPIVAEAALHVAVIVAALAATPSTLVPIVIVGVVIAGDSVFPVLSETFLHPQHGATALERTRTIRGRLFAWYFLELGYHLEHHAYPRVPTRRCAELSRRLAPAFAAVGVRPTQVI